MEGMLMRPWFAVEEGNGVSGFYPYANQLEPVKSCKIKSKGDSSLFPISYLDPRGERGNT